MANWLDTPGQTLPGNESVAPGQLRSYGYQQITDVSSATSLSVPTGALIALIQPETADVRWRDDGTAPTASVGMYLGQGATLPFTGNLNTIQFLQVASGATLNVSYYG